MARNYPTYIYHNETEAKSKGEFIIRTIQPRFIAKVIRDGTNYSFEFCDHWDPLTSLGNSKEEIEKKMQAMADDLHRWFKHKIETKKSYQFTFKMSQKAIDQLKKFDDGTGAK